MDTLHETPPVSTIPLGELFATHSQALLPDTGSDEWHAFEVNESRSVIVRDAAYRRAQARGLKKHEIDAQVFAEIAPVGIVD